MDYIFSDGMMEKDLIEIKDKDGAKEFVLKREIIEEKIKDINTKGIALDTIKWGIAHNRQDGVLYAGIHCGIGELYFSDKILNTNTIINLFSLDIKEILEAGRNIEDLYHDNFEGFKYTFDVKDKLDELYDQSFRRCKDCGGIVDNYKIEDEYYYDPEYPYRGVDGTHRTLYFKCRGCNKENSVCYVYGGEI